METHVTVAEVLQEILAQYGFSGAVVEETVSAKNSFPSKTYIVRVAEEDSRFLIGQFGNNLLALQHVARMIVGKKFPELAEEVFFVDINDYRKKKDQSIIDLARTASREAEKSGEPVLLRPMSAYERRLVHMELSKETKVITESVGEGDERRIAVKPV